MIERSSLSFAVACLLIGMPNLLRTISAQAAPRPATPPKAAAPAKPAPTTAQAAAIARRADLEARLKSGNKDQITQALVGYKAWFSEDAKAGENAYWNSRALILPLVDHANESLELIDLAKKYKTDARSGNIGYVYADKTIVLLEQGHDDEAMTTLVEGFDLDPAATGDELRTNLVPALAPLKKNKQVDTLFVMCLNKVPDNPAVTESLIKQRITNFNAMKDFDAALACAKSYFNVSSMATTSDAITIFDRQFLLPNMDDRSKVDQFRREQTTGAAPTPPGATPRTSPLVLSIKVEATAYEDALKKMTDDSTLKSVIAHASLLLIADRPKDALEVAKQGLAIANNPKEISTANELIARCYKAQDGTIGRANGWIAANPQAK